MNDSPLSPAAAWTSWICQLVAAVILAQTLFFKFSGAEESRFIFSALHVEPWGRWLAGVSELVCALLLLVPGLAVWGALLAVGVMLGALASHVLVLGIVVQDDGGLLFALALVTLACAAVVAWLRRADLPFPS